MGLAWHETWSSLLATRVSSSRMSCQDTTDPCTFGKAANIGVRLLTCSNSYRSTTLTWCNFMSFLEKGILPLSATMTRDTETRCQLCSARCISRAWPKAYTLNSNKRKQQESAELFDNAMKGVKFLLGLTLVGCKRHFSKN